MKTNHTLDEDDIAKAITFWFEHGCPAVAKPLSLSFYHYEAGSDPRERDYYTITVTAAKEPRP